MGGFLGQQIVHKMVVAIDIVRQSATSNSSLRFEVRELKFCMKTACKKMY